MKKILSLVLVIGMLCAMMVSVNATTDGGTLTLVPSATEVTVGDTFTVTVKFAANEGYAFRGGSLKIDPVSEYYTITNVEADADFTAAIANTAATIGEDTTNGGYLGTFVQAYTVKNLAAMNTIPQSGTFCTFTFEAVKAGSVDIALANVASNLAYFKSRTSMKATDEKKLSTGTEVAGINIKVKDVAPAGPAAPTYGTPVHDYSDVTVGDVIYQNVYVGTYTATPDTGATIAKVGVKAGETVVGEKDITVDGDATVSFKIALLGVEDGIDVGLTAFAEYAE